MLHAALCNYKLLAFGDWCPKFRSITILLTWMSIVCCVCLHLSFACNSILLPHWHVSVPWIFVSRFWIFMTHSFGFVPLFLNIVRFMYIYIYAYYVVRFYILRCKLSCQGWHPWGIGIACAHVPSPAFFLLLISFTCLELSLIYSWFCLSESPLANAFEFGSRGSVTYFTLRLLILIPDSNLSLSLCFMRLIRGVRAVTWGFNSFA